MLKNLRIIFWLIVFGIVTNYGPLQMVRFIRFQSPELLTYYPQVQDIFPNKINVKITFHKYWFQSDNILGTTYFLLFSKNEIHINPENWKWLTPIQKEILIIHELGHSECFILKHDDRLLTDGCYASIMSTYMDSDDCLKKHYIELKDDLRRKCGKY